MNHLSEEELVGHFYAANDSKGASARHLAACAQCAEDYAALRNDLAEFAAIEPPTRDAAYGERVWQAIAPSLPAFSAPARSRMRIRMWRGLAYAAACGLLTVTAFFAGRRWEQQRHPGITAVKQTTPEVKQRVVVVVLSDHLDRSERLLVELKHTDADSVEMASPLGDQARSLLAANRVCRQEAEKSGDRALATALDRLDRLLGEMANQPGGLNPAAIARLQKEMASESLLFEVRVLRSRIPDRQPEHNTRSNGGTI